MAHTASATTTRHLQGTAIALPTATRNKITQLLGCYVQHSGHNKLDNSFPSTARTPFMSPLIIVVIFYYNELWRYVFKIIYGLVHVRLSSIVLVVLVQGRLSTFFRFFGPCSCISAVLVLKLMATLVNSFIFDSSWDVLQDLNSMPMDDLYARGWQDYSATSVTNNKKKNARPHAIASLARMGNYYPICSGLVPC